MLYFLFLLVFVICLFFMPNKVKHLKTLQKSGIFALFGMKLKESQKTHKNEKTQHLNRCFKLKNQYKLFLCFVAYF